MSEQEQACRDRLKTFSCWVVKIGSSLITRSGQGLDEALIDSWSDMSEQEFHKLCYVALAQDGLRELASDLGKFLPPSLRVRF